MNKLWFVPLIVAAVFLTLLALLLILELSAPIAGWISLGVSGMAVIAAVLVRSRDPKPGAIDWLPWLAVMVGLVIIVFGTRQLNLLLLNAGIEMPDPIIREGKAQIASAMRDPTSVLFSDVTSSGGTVCGRVNGRNGFGAYAGATKFVWNRIGGSEIEGELASTGFANVDAMKQCFFDQAWTRCQGLPDDGTDCTRLGLGS